MKKIRNLITYLAILFVVVFVTASAFYCFYWVERPSYAITMICNAVKEKDATKFEKYVDLPSIYGSAYDEYTEIILENNGMKDKKIPHKMAKALVNATFQNVKPDVVNMLSKMTIESITNRADTEEKDVKKDKNGYGVKNIFKQFFNTLCEENNLEGLQAEDIKLQEVRNGLTEGTVKFSNKKGGEPLVVKFEMRKISGSNWKIERITNLPDIVARVNRPVTIESLF